MERLDYREGRRKKAKFVICEIHYLDKLLIQFYLNKKLNKKHPLYKQNNRMRPICANFYSRMSLIVTIFKIVYLTARG